MGLLSRITDRIAEKAAKRAFEVGLDTLNDVLQDKEKRNALLAPAWDYFDKRINLKIANLTSGRESLPGMEGQPEGMGLPGGLGALTSFLPPGLAQFAPLLGMMGGGTSNTSASSPAVLPLGAGDGTHRPGLRR